MTDAMTREEEDAGLAAEYVLGVLDAADRAAVERRIKDDTAFAGLVTKWEFDFAGMNAGFAEAPAPDLMPAIEARLFGQPATRAEAARLRRANGWWMRFAGGGVFAAVLAALLLVVLPVPPPEVPEGPTLAATLAGEGQVLAFAARYDAATREVVLIQTAGTPAAAGQVYELWLIAGDAAPASLGLIDAAEVRRPAADLPVGAVLAISLEPAGGSTTGAPTGPVLVTGVVTEL